MGSCATRAGEAAARRRQGSEPQEKRKTPVPGLAKGMVTVPDGFDAPLEDFKEYTRC